MMGSPCPSCWERIENLPLIGEGAEDGRCFKVKKIGPVNGKFFGIDQGIVSEVRLRAGFISKLALGDETVVVAHPQMEEFSSLPLVPRKAVQAKS